jgi:protein-tyrosine-phosphatase
MADPSGEFRKLVADELRWQLLEELAKSDRKVHELVASSGRPQNLISYHLGRLRRAGLITQHRSAADARDLYYQLNLDRFTELYLSAAVEVQPVLALVGPVIARLTDVVGTPLEEPSAAEALANRWRILFVCTANSARSQMAEAFTRELSESTLRGLSGGPVQAESAGTKPQPVHPMTIRVMNDLGVSMAGHRSKSLEEVRHHGFHRVITLCDRAREACPPIPGVVAPVHWSLPDPSEVSGSEEEVYEAFREVALAIAARVRHLLAQVGAERRASNGDGKR